ncbi:MAG: deoxyribose-phosphate aldolase [Lachnospiraceae bacterium]|nr:deoxyribose-phosphate aldolase [Lachnospiraceae bacterium]
MIANLNKYVDHTILKAFATRKDVEKLCAAAKEYDFASVCVNPMYVSLARDLLEGTTVNICTVIGFPLGANTTAIKAAETEQAYIDGCNEFDMVIAVGALKEGRYDYVRNDIQAVVKAAKGRTVKVIIETAYLTDEEKIMACRLCTEAGANFVKTCTGFSTAADAPNFATVHDIELMRANIAPEMKVKASSGIRTYEDALALINAGAERLGTSAGVKILEGAEAAK